jgi:hypothetical protein
VDETRAMVDGIDRGRASFAQGAWREAYALLSAADGEAGLDLEDLERLGAVAIFSAGMRRPSMSGGARIGKACGSATSGGRPVVPSGRPSCF